MIYTIGNAQEEVKGLDTAQFIETLSEGSDLCTNEYVGQDECPSSL
jgi:hypothetical protein